MKLTSPAGTVSGCIVWLLTFLVFGLCLAPTALIFAIFTGSSGMAARVVGPLVCPENSTAQMETGTATYVDDEGFTRTAATSEMICVDAAGTVVARPAPLPGWLWTGIAFAAAILLAGLLALLFAAPAGVLVGRLAKRRRA
jgi:hypothetical protein